jgi:hypothetical protein
MHNTLYVKQWNFGSSQKKGDPKIPLDLCIRMSACFMERPGYQESVCRNSWSGFWSRSQCHCVVCNSTSPDSSLLQSNRCYYLYDPPWKR